MAEHQNKSQEEYNELLGITQSMLGDMSAALSELDEKTDKRNKKLSTQISLTKSIIKDVSDEKSLLDAIALINDNITETSKMNFGINTELAKKYKIQASAINGILQKHKETQNILGRVNSIIDHVSEKFGGVFETISEGLGEIPLIGSTLQKAFHPLEEKGKEMLSFVTGAFKEGFKKTFMQALISGKGFTAATFNGIIGGFRSAMMAAKLFVMAMNPATLIALGIAAAIGLGIARFHAVEKAATEFKTTTGLASADLHDIEHTVGNISNKFGYLGVSAADASKYMSEFTDAFDGLVIPAESTVAAIAVMNKNFGVTAKSAADVNKIFQNLGGFTEEAAASLSLTVVEMANLVGVSPEKVMKDMADNAGDAYQYFRGSPQELAKAAVHAAKMGTSLKDMSNAANKLLDFEESISKELEASALLGVNLNFQKARDAAFNGDLLGMQRELTKELANAGDISKMSTYEKQALVDATGQELDTLLNTQRIYNQFGDLDEKRLAAANELIASGKDISNVSRDELDAQTKRMEKQQQMQDMMSGMTNRIAAIGTAMGDALAPVAGVLLKGLSLVVDVLSSVLIPTFKLLGGIIYYATKPLYGILSVFKTIIEYAKEYSDYLIAAGIGAAIVLGYQKQQLIVETYLNVQRFIGKQFTKEGLMYRIAEYLYTKASIIAEGIYNSIILFGTTLKKQGLMVAIAEMAARAFASVSSIPFIGPILGAVAAVAALALGKSFFSKAGDVYSPADGKTRISTKEGGLFELSQNDDVLAGPGLGAAMQGGGGEIGIQSSGQNAGGVANLITSLIAEMQGIRNDLATGKVAVYMDGQLVTSKIANIASKSPIT